MTISPRKEEAAERLEYISEYCAAFAALIGNQHPAAGAYLQNVANQLHTYALQLDPTVQVGEYAPDT